MDILTMIINKIKRIKKQGQYFFSLRAHIFWHYYYKVFPPWKYFKFQGQKYAFFNHKYNCTWKNERIIEIPIIKSIINQSANQEILEVGNVLSHYYKINHDIVDKYEKGKGIINEDIINYTSHKKYDLIISISTLEHVGWDEQPKNDFSILKAITNLKRLIKPHGKIIITMPWGYNLKMDEYINKQKIKFLKKYCFKRISRDNRWIQVDWNTFKNIQYNYPFPNANGIIIGEIKLDKDKI